MPNVFGREFTREELEQRTGRMDQVCGVRAAVLTDGRAAGVRVADVWTGSGLEFTVLLDRAMDIGAARWQGKSLCWRSSVGDVHPAYFEPDGIGWLRSFGGDLITTCGLTQAGAAGVDEGRALGLHGRISNLPAENVHLDAAWDDDGHYVVWAAGRVRQASVFGENVVLTRRVFTQLGENRVWIHDSVRNEGYERAEHMLLYHVNLGFPVVDDGTVLVAPSRAVTPRDAEAEEGKEAYAEFRGPRRGYREKVYYHEMRPESDGLVPVALVNRHANAGAGFGVYLLYGHRELPHFVEWKMLGQGTYVVGLEPANCLVEGRAKERAEGRLQFLEPGEQRNYRLEIGVLPSLLEIAAFEERVGAIARKE
ncbi:MAG: aldose 1-epimerase family protein [Armatimonadetes bacterium]|nr:aldose 1-epimerase family protein [Armatimonadota bacterium]